MRLLQTIKLILAVLFIYAANELSAQSNNLIFSADETGVSQTHVVCKEIRLKPGYRYTASAFTTMHSYIDPNMICDVDYLPNGFSGTTLPTLPDPAYEVGATPGSFAVTPTGAAVYNIPLLVSPGTAGMQPNLSVSYNSQGGDGLMGVGWNLGGLSSITRVGGTLYHNPNLDQPLKGVNLSYTDFFALDGNRLLPYQDAPQYGYDGKIYTTELESFSKIISYGVTGNGPSYFIVQTKDGSTLEYGNTTDSRIEASGNPTVLTWLLNKVTDSRGNYMKIYYYENNSTGEFRPSYIEYTGNDNAGASLVPYNKVKFVYGNRQDKQRAYVVGSQVNSNVLLTNVEMYEGNNKMHEYSFNYSMDMNSHLSEVMEAGADGKRYNSTKIVWNTNSITPVVRSELSGVPLSTPGTSATSIDVNGDGFTDVITTGDNFHWYTFTNNGDGTYTQTGTTTFTDQNHASGLAVSNVAGKVSGDFDGDGYDDMVVMGLNGANWLGFNKDEHFKLFFLHSVKVGNNYYEAEDQTNTLEFTWTQGDKAKFKYTLGDFDGDGATDLFIYFYDGDKGFIHSFKNKVNYEVLGDVGDSNVKFTTTDLNGDGKNEILLYYSNYSQVYEFNYNYSTNAYTFNAYPQMGYPSGYHRVYTGDFNGDGKTDLLTWSNAGSYWYVAYSKGDMQYFDPVPAGIPNWGDPDVATTYHTYIVQDFNGDGKSDILDKSTPNGGSPTYLTIYYGTGSVGKPGGDFITPGTSYSDLYKDFSFGSLAGDFNGDGCMEAVFDRSGSSFSVCSMPVPHSNNQKVNIISDGLCNRTYMEYNTLPLLAKLTTPQYTKGTLASYPVNDFQKPITVVSNTYLYHSLLSSYNNTLYSYSGAKVHLQGKGFLGFTGFKTAVNGFITEDTYNSDMAWLTGHFFQSTLYKSKTTTDGGLNISEKTVNTCTFNSGANLPLGSFWGKGYFYYPSSVTDVDYLHGTISTTTSTSQDNYGNVTSQTVTNPAGTSTTTNIYEVKGVAWTIKNHITSSSTTTTRTNEPSYTRLTTFENLGLGGLPSKKIEDVGVTTEYTYNAFGLPETTKVSGNLITDRYTYALYDSQKRFVIKVTNPLGHIVESTYDPAYGNVLTQKDANLLIESFAYDGFGRLKETTSPTGSKATSTLTWDIASNYLYKSTNADPGGAYSKQYYDPLSRAVKAETNNFDGSVISTTKIYNLLGQLVTETEPNNTGLFTSYEYESDYKRLRKITYPSGSTKEYAYSNTTVTTTTTDAIGAKITSSTTDAAGLVISSTDADGNALTYLYHSSGQPRQITAPGNAITTMVYDAYGRQTKLTDPDAGVTTYSYDVLGQLTNQQTAKQKAANSTYSTTITYDLLGRVFVKSDPQEGTITNAYDPANGKGMLASVTTTGAPNAFNVNCAYTYDSFSRVKTKTETIPGISVNPVYTYDYDNLGRVTTVGYPSHTGLNSFSVTNTYNTNGYLSETRKTSDNSLIWQCNSMNARGQITQNTLGNQIVYTKGYSNLGFLQSQTMSYNSVNLVAYTYNFEPTTGNLQNRTTGNGITENFQYDNLDRLSQVSHTAAQSTLVLGMDYTGNGNINNKSDVGDYVYGTAMPPAGPHAVVAINNPSSSIPTLQQDILYTAFNKAKNITEGTYAATISYGFDQQRRNMVVTNNGSTVVTKYYVGDYEKTVAGSVTRELHYLGDAIFVRNTTGSTVTDSMYYIHADHLGSIATVFDQNRNIKAKYSYDAWGRRRNYTDYTYTLSGLYNQNVFDRFYTGHESIPLIGGTGGGLINMNGRMYDPLIARMLSSDNYASGGSTQKANRYSYVFNNPLKYTDPTGNWTGWDDLAAIGIGGALNVAAHWDKITAGGKFNGWAFAEAFAIGAFAGEAALLTGGAAIGAAGLGEAATFGTITAAGAIGGAAGSATGSLILGTGNNIAFGDPYSPKQFLKDVAIGTVAGAALAYPAYRIAKYFRPTGSKLGPGPDPISKSVEGDTPTPSLVVDKMTADEIPQQLQPLDPIFRNQNPELSTSGRQFVVGPDGQTIPIPENYYSTPANNGNGIVYRPNGSTGDANAIRIMGPTVNKNINAPNGYFRVYNKWGQPIDIYSGKPLGNDLTHFIFNK